MVLAMKNRKIVPTLNNYPVTHEITTNIPYTIIFYHYIDLKIYNMFIYVFITVCQDGVLM